MARPDVMHVARAAFGSERVRLGLATSAVSALAGLLVSLAVARLESIDVVGEFAIAGASYALAAGAVRAGFAETVLVVDSEGGQASRDARRASTVAVVGAAVLIGVGTALSSWYIATAGLALHGLCVYEYIKTMNIARFSARSAFKMEILWFAAAGPIATAAVLGLVAPLIAYATWALAGCVVGYGFAIKHKYKFIPSVRGPGISWRLSGTYVADYLIGSGSSQLSVNVLSATAGTGVAGALRAAGTLLGPAALVLGPARALMIKQLSSLPQSVSTWRRAASMAVVLLVPVLPILIVVAYLPSSVASSILGESWQYAAPVAPWLALEMAFSATSAVAFAGHKSLLIARETVSVRSLLAVARIGGIVTGGIQGGAQGAAIAMAAVSALGCVIWWVAYVRGLRKASRSKENTHG